MTKKCLTAACLSEFRGVKIILLIKCTNKQEKQNQKGTLEESKNMLGDGSSLSLSLSCLCLSVSVCGPTQFPFCSIHLQIWKSPADWIHADSPDLVVHPNGGHHPAGHVAAGRGGAFPQLNGPSRVVTVRMAQDGQRAPIVW